MTRLLTLLAFAFLSPLPSPANELSAILLDGDLGEWTDADHVASDPVGDAIGAFDLSRVSARVSGTQIFLRFDTQATLNLQSGTEDDGTLRLLVEMPRNHELAIDLRGRSALLRTPEATLTIPWSDLKFASLPTFAANDFELRLDLKAFDLKAGDQVRLRFEGSDELAEPIALSIGRQATQSKKLQGLGAPAESVRIASLNTLKQGSASPERAPLIKQMFEFADADIFCFNEELDEAKFRNSFQAVVPNEVADTKNVHWSATCAIVSRFPLTPLDFRCREAAALIELPSGKSIVVASVHFKCCGFTGSREDQRRIEEVNELLSDLQRVRSGEFGEKAAAAGIVVLGDFNLVGSRKPLDLINEAGLTDVMLTCPVDGSAMTWQGVSPRESFWPGRLDYVTLDLQRLKWTGGFVINSEQFRQVTLGPEIDTPASDHSMLVVDVKPLL
ncbi:endonuclease/exonuclease/phosphatase family protein [Roseiconus lacunae]|uniref:Endonuclease/exonuclease/phosphatase family protein n=1 Tax=Roseiconus lacunae TaxID=2605694 RepID=A0ABT7PT73_9BACT|nr:endonuclease/exonuclease/phosphatase family protein [Roseiconus lacunae]MDM4019336.1 endonuclease/exonuclease/phosphatase family protein [Roseiconus lacunae]